MTLLRLMVSMLSVTAFAADVTAETIQGKGNSVILSTFEAARRKRSLWSLIHRTQKSPLPLDKTQRICYNIPVIKLQIQKKEGNCL